MRTKDGIIAKAKYIEYDEIDKGHKVLDSCEFDKPVYYEYGEGYYNLYDDEEFEEIIVKHSPNIIDLIEVGDYVNGKFVSNVDKIDNRNVIEWEDGDMYSTEILNDKFIKTIATKELMQSIEYRVEE